MAGGVWRDPSTRVTPTVPVRKSPGANDLLGQRYCLFSLAVEYQREGRLKYGALHIGKHVSDLR